MANGVAAARLLPASAPADTTGKPNEPIERAIGAAAADACMVLVQGLIDWEAAGAMSATTRTASGECLARVVWIQMDSLGKIPDFRAVMLAEGRRILHQRHDAFYRQHHGVDLPDAALDEILGWIINITDRVVAGELARGH